MKYELIVYFNGPLSKWITAINENEVLYKAKFKTLFFARLKGLSFSSQLKNVAWHIGENGIVIEQSP